ncbi:class 3 adenylate cyclase [Rhizobium sp. 57MFTsu3.2]|nr:class 3 adenylate cyclase [Rhizobium sp. 57MFTsu3.2]
MARTPLKRRLAAIMATDVVGYSRLMEADEEATLASVKAMQEELIRPNVEREGGRVFKLMGDGTLAVFDSVNGAVECAIAIQGELMRQPEGSRLILRIGINLADVLVDGTDLFGDGVNVASRIEASAFPGGISITDGVYHQIAKRTGTDFVDGGERVLKNIDRPVRVWHWQPRYNGFVEEERPRPADGAIAKTAVRITAAPSTAPQQLDLAELVVSSLEDLLTEQRWLDVSRVGSASAALDGHATRPYDYTVKIGIHGAGPFRVNAKFLHTNVTPVMWSRAFDLPESYHFDVVELVAAEIGSLVQDKVLLAASEMIAKKPQSSWSADENFLYGRMLDSKHMLPEAEVFFLRATELDPGMIYAQASYAIARLTVLPKQATSSTCAAPTRSYGSPCVSTTMTPFPTMRQRWSICFHATTTGPDRIMARRATLRPAICRFAPITRKCSTTSATWNKRTPKSVNASGWQNIPRCGSG